MTLRGEIRRRPFRGRHSQAKPTHQDATRFSDLPVEVIAIILGYLAGLRDLFSAVQSCHRSLDSYNEHGHQIVPAILRRECTKVIGHDVGQVFWELDFAVRRDFLRRDHVQAVLLDYSWPLFQRRQLEELLLPLVGALAWTFWTDNRQADAIAALLKVRARLRSPSEGIKVLQLVQLFTPVSELLAELPSSVV